ncbi:MAG: winged helix DNA-binding domain-containing protein [Promicromonosporaceae bacterium]|nr:winged helix DNA-binding domain-containing protein [Promicromonosporaceae bacterium]
MGKAKETLSVGQARRVALAAQGLAKATVAGAPEPGLRQATATARRLGVIQIDSVNVLARAHLLPLYSRLGPYDVGLLDRMAGQAPRRLIESWAHEASFIPVETWPLLAHRRAAAREHWLIGHADLSATLIEGVRSLLAEHGPATAAQLHQIHDAPDHPKAEYWSTRWTAAKAALEVLFATGEVCGVGRTQSFERVYDVVERALPSKVLAMPTPDEATCVRGLIEIAARAHGVATARDLKDYFRLGSKYGGARGAGHHVASAIANLADDGVLIPVEVRGLPADTRPEAWYLHRDAVLPRQAVRRALLSPFDPLVFERTRLEQLFDIEHRLEIYTPQAKRRWGYYVLLFLDGEAITARVDLKADRPTNTLLVQAAHLAAAVAPSEIAGVAERLAAELHQLAGWLTLETIGVTPRGDLALPLRHAL